jgi:hypothetical protein
MLRRAICVPLNLNRFYSTILIFAGPLAGALAGKIGCRMTGILGSLIASVSLVISTFSPNIAVLTFTYGAMAGR